jgi:hypothetical protein
MMMKLRILLVIGVLALASIACTVNFDGFGLSQGSGVLVTEDREIGEFSKVSLEGFGEMSITQGEEASLIITAEDNIIDKIITEVRGDTLVITFERGFNVAPTKKISFELVVVELEELNLAGAGDMYIEELESTSLDVTISGAGSLDIDHLEAKDVNIELSGAGDVVIAGEVIDQELRLSGAGNYNAGELQSQTAVVEISGFGNSTLWVTDALDITMSGAGQLEYYGQPVVSQNVSGAGSIQSLDD